ncbi:NACHT domain-containing protein [Streptomyces sp. NPDC054770]
MERDVQGEGNTGDGDIRNEFSGAGGPVIQGRDFLGDVIINGFVNPPAKVTEDAALVQAADDLAVAVKRQWREEAALRRLNDPYPLPVRWRPAPPQLMEPWRSLVRLATTGVGRASSASPSGWASGPEALSGGGGDLVRVLTRVPTGRLVVLGEPGSGKSMLLVRLVLDLLAHRRHGDPVPVLVSLASWDPDREDLDLWLEQRLGIDYPWLSEPGRTGANRGRELLDADAIMLVLDGLDEIPDRVRGRAIARINDALGLRPDLGMVLSSRSDPFAATVRPRKGPEVRVTGAAGVEIEPLALDIIASYLLDSAGGPTNEARWRGVFAALAAEHDLHPLGQLFTTPLMAYLARVVYNPSPDAAEDIAYDSGLHGRPLDPAQDSTHVLVQDSERGPTPDEHHAPAGHPFELLDRSQFPTPTAIRAHLLDAFIPASYTRHRTSALAPARPSGSRRGWTRGQAAHFLTFLARDLEHRQQGTTDLRWWDLADAAPRILVGATVGLVAVPAGVLMPFGAWLGVGMLVGVTVAMIGRRWSPPARSFNRGLAGGLIGSVLGSAFGLGMRFVLGIHSPAGYFVSGLALGLVPGFLGGFRAGLAGGIAASFVGAFVGEPEMGDSASLVNSVGFGVAAACVVTLGHSRLPARGLRWSPLGILTGLGGGLAIGIAVALQTGLFSGLVSGVVAAAGGSFGAGLEAKPAEATVAADPQTVLDQDRVTFWTTAMAGGLAIGLAASVVIASVLGPWRGALTGVADGLATGLAWGFLQARYGSFTLARWWLALRGQVPWRLMSFLADAHRRGVLRQVGATYQLRHAELQRRLAGRT